MIKDLITIIVPIYNAEKYLERCIESIIHQSYRNLEIILVDDGSIDNSPKICDDYANKDNRIKVIHKENEGVSIARNEGLKKAQGKYVLFADSDDWLEKEMCQEMISEAVLNDLDIVICEYNNFYENKDYSESVKLKEYKDLSFAELITNDENKYGGFPWNKLIKREVIINKFNENIYYYENLLFFLENSEKIKKYSVVHKALYNYNINDNSAVHTKKYSLRKLSALEALTNVIPLVPDKYRDEHKLIFIRSYYNNLYSMKKQKYNLNQIYIYKEDIKKYYKDVINSKNIGLKKKLLVIALVKFNFIYSFYKSIKR